MSTNHFNFFFRLFAHLAKTAFLALSLRCSGVSFAARALPPLRPPSRPSATAAAFFVGFDIAYQLHENRTKRRATVF